MKIPLFQGSSKQFFSHDATTYLMSFKDCLHGAAQSDEIHGTGHLRQAFTYFFFRLLEKKQIQTHLTKDAMCQKGLLVKALVPIKLEIIVRNIARGHWVDEHKIPLFQGGEKFDPPLVEFCLKWKTTLANGQEIDDPRISPELAVHLNSKAKDSRFRNALLHSLEEAERLKQLALAINRFYSALLLQAGWQLEDFKFEVGVFPNDPSRQLILIDEISPDCSRIRDRSGKSLTKDLFRERRPKEEIYQGYKTLTEWIERAYAVHH